MGLLGFEAGLLELERLSVFANGADLGLVEALVGDCSDLKADFQLDPLDSGELLDHLAGDAAKVTGIELRVQGGRAKEPGFDGRGGGGGGGGGVGPGG